MFRLALLSLTLLIFGCEATYYKETDTEIRLTYGGGGMLAEKLRIYEPLYDAARAGKKVIIDGPMISADAFYPWGISDVCYTENAVWSPHAISAGGLYRLGRETDNIMLYLPKPLRAWFKKSSYYWNFLTVPAVDYEQLLRIWPEGACRQEDVRTITQSNGFPSTPIRQLSMNGQFDREELRTPTLR